MWPPSRTGIGSRFMMPSCSEIMAISATSVDPAAAEHLAGDAGDRDRAAQLLHASFGAEEAAEGDEGVAQHLPVLLDAVLKRRDERELADLGRRDEAAIRIASDRAWPRRAWCESAAAPRATSSAIGAAFRCIDDGVELGELRDRLSVRRRRCGRRCAVPACAAGEPGVTRPTIGSRSGRMPARPTGPYSLSSRSGVIVVRARLRRCGRSRRAAACRRAC